MGAELCVILTGTFGAGKTSVAKQLIANHGVGIDQGDFTYTRDGQYGFAGHFKKQHKFGGCDKIGSTRKLAGMVADCVSPVFIAEGTRVGTFGLNPLKAFFNAKKQLYICLDVSFQTAS